MVERQADPARVFKSLRWPAAAVLTVALALGAARTAHAGTHMAAHTSAHVADGNGNGNGNNDGNGNKGHHNGDPTDGVATPELGSGELAALGLVPVAGIILYRRSLRRSKDGATAR